MILSVDIETYKFYDGSKECEEYIIANSTDNGEYFKSHKKLWNYYPVLDPREFTIGAVLKEGCKKPKFFTKADDLYNYLLKTIKQNNKEGHNTYIYAHNHHYDFQGYAQNHLTDVEDYNILNYSVMYGSLGKVLDEEGEKQNTGYLLDTRHFFKGSLDKIGEMLGIPKLTLPRHMQNIDEIKTYLTRDVELVLMAMKELRKTIEELGYTPHRFLTAGNLAKTIFQSFCLKNYNYSEYYKKQVPYYNYMWYKGDIVGNNYSDYIRLAYRGARCECFQQGVFEDVTMIDINSLYPYILSEKFKFPNLFTEKYYEQAYEIFGDKLFKKNGVAKATVRFPKKIDIPYLPINYNQGIFFKDKIRVKGCWTLYELGKAKELGYVIEEIHSAVIYEENLPFNPFQKFYRELYEKRLNSKGIMKRTIKLLMNSLGSKFGQMTRITEKKKIHRSERINYDNTEWEYLTSWEEYDILERFVEEKQPKYAHMYISTIMTAIARTYLYDELCKIPKEDLLYCDTDSIAFKGDHIHKFNISEDLGDWKIEYEKSKGAFVKAKVYNIQDPKEPEHFKEVVAGFSSHTISSNVIWGKESVIARHSYGLKRAFNTGKFDKVGQFYKTQKKVDPNNKHRNLCFPDYYEEDFDRYKKKK